MHLVQPATGQAVHVANHRRPRSGRSGRTTPATPLGRWTGGSTPPCSGVWRTRRWLTRSISVVGRARVGADHTRRGSSVQISRSGRRIYQFADADQTQRGRGRLSGDPARRAPRTAVRRRSWPMPRGPWRRYRAVETADAPITPPSHHPRPGVGWRLADDRRPRTGHQQSSVRCWPSSRSSVHPRVLPHRLLLSPRPVQCTLRCSSAVVRAERQSSAVTGTAQRVDRFLHHPGRNGVFVVGVRGRAALAARRPNSLYPMLRTVPSALHAQPSLSATAARAHNSPGAPKKSYPHTVQQLRPSEHLAKVLRQVFQQLELL